MSGRTDLPLLRVYASEHVHSSIDKSVITLGLGTESLRKIPVNGRFEIIAELLADAIEEDIENGIVPICVIPTIGTTSTSSVDPVDAVADICEKYGIWLHVDAAYGGFFRLLADDEDLLEKEDAAAYRAIAEADSIVVDPHKHGLQPYGCGCVLMFMYFGSLNVAFTV